MVNDASWCFVVNSSGLLAPKAVVTHHPTVIQNRVSIPKRWTYQFECWWVMDLPVVSWSSTLLLCFYFPTLEHISHGQRLLCCGRASPKPETAQYTLHHPMNFKWMTIRFMVKNHGSIDLIMPSCSMYGIFPYNSGSLGRCRYIYAINGVCRI